MWMGDLKQPVGGTSKKQQELGTMFNSSTAVVEPSGYTAIVRVLPVPGIPVVNTDLLSVTSARELCKYRWGMAIPGLHTIPCET